MGKGGYLHDACPLGKLWNPSFRMASSCCVHAVQLTSTLYSGSAFPNPPPTRYFPTSAGFNWHLDSKSGLGFPIKSLSPSVAMNVVTSASPKPIHAVLNSHSLSLSRLPLVEAEVGDGGGTWKGVRTKEATSVMPAGMTSAATARSHVGTLGSVTYG